MAWYFCAELSLYFIGMQKSGISSVFISNWCFAFKAAEYLWLICVSLNKQPLIGRFDVSHNTELTFHVQVKHSLKGVGSWSLIQIYFLDKYLLVPDDKAATGRSE